MLIATLIVSVVALACILATVREVVRLDRKIEAIARTTNRLSERYGQPPDHRLTDLVARLVDRVEASSTASLDAALSAIEDYRLHKINMAEKADSKPSSTPTYNGGANTLTPFPIAEVRPPEYGDNVG